MTEQPPQPQQLLYGGRGSVPVPDPTALTEQRVGQSEINLRREIASAIALLEAKLVGQADVVQTRLVAMDKALELQQSDRELLPGRMDGRVEQIGKLFDERLATMIQRFATVDERFTGVALQFKERDTRSERESRDNKVAVDAAFAAQKEAASEQNKSNTLAIDKSEKATAETLNKQADLFKSTTDALDGKIEDAKQIVNKMDTRLTAIESRGVVVRETQTQNNWGIATFISAFAVLISLVGLIVILVKIG